MITYILVDTVITNTGVCPPDCITLRKTYVLRLIHMCHAIPLPCRAALIHMCHAVPLPFSDSAVSFVKVHMVARNIRTASPTV
jgi:hypothetical protein